MAVSIAEIIVLSLIADWACRRAGIPGLIGMLAVGVLLGPYVLGYLDPDLLAIGPDLRLIALIVILLRVGFELSRRTLHRVGGRVLLLAFIPATFEGLMVAAAGPWLLGLTLLESAILGSVLAAVSPAVVVPAMIRFMKERKGAAKDIPSMVMAAASVDDIYVIVVHSVVMGLYVGRQVNVAWQIAGIPMSLVLGGGVGLLVGAGLYRLFDRFNPRATKRVLIVLALSILLVRLQFLLAGHVPFAGLVAAMGIGFIILEKREHMAHEISAKLAKLWVFAEIVLFSMVGAQVNLAVVCWFGTGSSELGGRDAMGPVECGFHGVHAGKAGGGRHVLNEQIRMGEQAYRAVHAAAIDLLVDGKPQLFAEAPLQSAAGQGQLPGDFLDVDRLAALVPDQPHRVGDERVGNRGHGQGALRYDPLRLGPAGGRHGGKDFHRIGGNQVREPLRLATHTLHKAFECRWNHVLRADRNDGLLRREEPLRHEPVHVVTAKTDPIGVPPDLAQRAVAMPHAGKHHEARSRHNLLRAGCLRFEETFSGIPVAKSRWHSLGFPASSNPTWSCSRSHCR